MLKTCILDCNWRIAVLSSWFGAYEGSRYAMPRILTIIPSRGSGPRREGDKSEGGISSALEILERATGGRSDDGFQSALRIEAFYLPGCSRPAIAGISMTLPAIVSCEPASTFFICFCLAACSRMLRGRIPGAKHTWLRTTRYHSFAGLTTGSQSQCGLEGNRIFFPFSRTDSSGSARHADKTLLKSAGTQVLVDTRDNLNPPRDGHWKL
ncbi:hypothetical protein B0T16DRAFT_42808 [Cercophora newfieldiana]|uniref:Uncharacterized protein n=1 Tax=Cercophora newfieldiana TaxID=92897 RepID=A0AA40CZ13_9PEZI|nr:hypothetical protein B0T16DRAFT_42808 [Cercophora newfieldiana]